jgi:hypothetical protein
LELGELIDDLFRCPTGGKVLENERDRDSKSSYAGLPPTNMRVDRDPGQWRAHETKITAADGAWQPPGFTVARAARKRAMFTIQP